jgi:hypothetical protein
MAKPTAQQCHALITYYINEYEAVNKATPSVNRNKAKYAFEAVLYDYTVAEARALVEFYVRHYDRDLDWFAYNYEKVVAAKDEWEQDQKLIRIRRDDTALALERWKKRKEELSARRRSTDGNQGT